MAISTSLSTIILAGGRSSRMGRDKATIEIAGVPLIRRIYDVVAAIPEIGSIHVVTPWAQRYRPLLPNTCDFIAELQPDRGPLVGFAQGLAQIESDWMLLLACDLPNLTTRYICDWITGLATVPASSIAYLPKHERGWESLCGFYRQDCRASLISHIDAGGRSFQGWLATQQVMELKIAEPDCLANCNTAADLAKVVADHPIDLE